MKKEKIGLLLINLGTPASTNVKDIRNYLKEFLMDPRVINIPYWKRYLLVNGIIAPFRAPKVQKEYQKLWLPEGSPLKVISESLTNKLQRQLYSDGYIVRLAMRYGHPNIESQLEELKEQNIDKLILLPLFPQYASATTGTALEEAYRIIGKQKVVYNTRGISYFHQHPLYIQSLKEKVEKDINTHQPDHILFSFHGLPVSQIEEIGKDCDCSDNTRVCDHDKPYCYKSACYRTAKLLVEALEIKPDKYSIAFQSRLGKTPWIEPYTEDQITRLAKAGVKKLHVIAPSFVVDCLETTIEIGEQYRDQFIALGGSSFTWSESLNDDTHWVENLAHIINE